MIYILWPTIRPQIFKNMHNQWIQKAKNPSNIKTNVAVNTQDQANELLDYNVIITNSEKIGVCYSAYQLTSKLEANDNDIVILASDDFLPPQNWDEYLINKLDGKNGALFVRDGYQLPDSSNMLHPAITIPIMTFSCLKELNKAVYHPEFLHMFSDCELYYNLKDLGLLIDNRLTDGTVFEHLHHAAGKRPADNNDKTYYNNWGADEITWNRRRLMSLEDRLKINK
jgi:hypothetical protein